MARPTNREARGKVRHGGPDETNERGSGDAVEWAKAAERPAVVTFGNCGSVHAIGSRAGARTSSLIRRDAGGWCFTDNLL
jgi:hypothetical protein